MICRGCSRLLDAPRARAAIAVAVAGDEYVFSYWPCEGCGRCTITLLTNRFLGEAEVDVLDPPLSKEDGDRVLTLVAACPSPGDKLCRCASHRALRMGRPPAA